MKPLLLLSLLTPDEVQDVGSLLGIIVVSMGIIGVAIVGALLYVGDIIATAMKSLTASLLLALI